MSVKTLSFRALLLGCAAVGEIWPGNIVLAGLAGQSALVLGDEYNAEMFGRRALQSLSASPQRLRRLSAMAARISRKRVRLDDAALTRSLVDFQDCLEAAELTPFLVFGTLLGRIREQRFIPGDTDIDFGILGVSRLEIARDALSRSSRFRIAHYKHWNGELSKLTVRHETGCRMDLKAFSTETGGVSWSSFNEAIALRRHYPGTLRLRRRTFQGVAVNVPDEAEAFLAWHYGDWRQPDAGYHWLTSGPIRSEEQRAWMRVGAPLAVLKSIIHSGLKKSLLMAQNAGDLFPEDELWRDIARALKGAMADQAQPR
jgi:hypothetical protein